MGGRHLREGVRRRHLGRVHRGRCRGGGRRPLTSGSSRPNLIAGDHPVLQG